MPMFSKVIACGKRLRSWIAYDPPYALSMSAWRLFDKEFKQKAPLRYWVYKTLPRALGPIRYNIRRIREWIRYRTFDRYHIVDTGLSPEYYEFEDRMLFASFNMLKDFVEKEQAWSYQCWNQEAYPFTRAERLPLYYIMYYRKPELGIKYFEWASTLDASNLSPNDQCIPQAIAARETLELYRWWVDVRPNRNRDEPVRYSDQGFECGVLDCDFDKTAPDYVAYNRWFEDNERMESIWKDEDTEMLCRLARLRARLWT